MAFHEVRFPPHLSFGSAGGPERRVEIVALASGFEERSALWAESRRRYDAGTALSTLDELSAVLAFFEARGGPLHGFRWKDWSDFRSSPPSQAITPFDQNLGDGDEATRAFQLRKGYGSGGVTAWRTIRKPVAGTVRVAVSDVERVEGTDWTLDAATGVVTFAIPPDLDAPVTAGFEFDVPARFDAQAIRVELTRFRAGEVPEVPVVEIRL